MTKTKEVDVHNSATRHFFASPKERRLHLRQKMESGGGTEGSDGVHRCPLPEPGELSAAPGEKKKINRAPSPARPKDGPGWSHTKIRGGIATPSLSVKPGAGIHLGSRVSRRSPGGSVGAKDGKAERSKPTGKASNSSSSSSSSSSALCKAKAARSSGGRRKVSDASIGSDDLSKDSGCAAGKLSPTDSSSELSDCASEENKLSTDAVSSDAESRSSRGGGPDGDKPPRDGASADRTHLQTATRSTCSPEEKDQGERLYLGGGAGEGSVSPGEERSLTSFDSRMPASTSLAFSDLTEEFMDGLQEEFVREIEELRSENDYLKDEMEELRSEMLEMRDMYLEEDVYQLQELRQQLEQANKTCRILQYRLRKAERRSIRVAQTGQVDGELIRTLEQDVKVAKDVSIRLHSQLDSVEKKRSRLGQENEELRVRLQDLEVAKQVLQQEIDKNTQKKRGRPNNKPEKKPCPQEDSSDLKCQLHFAKEESALMCKKLTKLVKDSDAMKEELAKYRSLYGDVNVSLTVEEVADSPHTREAEVRIHLKLVEEEANLLSRRIVELEVENRGLRAEMDDMKGPQDAAQELNGVSGPGAGLGLGGGASVLGGGASSENVMELQRHLQFVEEEAELLRRSLIEMEEQNKLLMNEINRYKSELPPPASALSSHSLASLADGLLNDSPSMHPMQDGAVLISTDPPAQDEELRLARLQIGELSGKVKKLQYENRVLLSNLQRCDLASYHAPCSPGSPSSLRLALETDAEAGDSAECLPNSPPHRREPVGGENDAVDIKERKMKMEDTADAPASLPVCLGQKDHDALLAMRDQARLVSTAIQLLTSPESNCLSMTSSLYHKVCSSDAAEPCDLEKPPPHSQMLELSDLADRPLVGALTSRLQALHSQLQAFVERVDNLGKPPAGRRNSQVEGESPLASPCTSLFCSGDGQDGLNTAEKKQPDFRDQSESDVRSQAEESSQLDNKNIQKQENNQPEKGEKEADDALRDQSSELQSDGEETTLSPQRELEKERQPQGEPPARLTQLQEEHQRALLRRDFQLQSLGLQARLQQKMWSQERTLLVQESQHLKQALLLLSLKLRCFLKQWRLGCKDTEWKDVLEMNSLKDLYLLLEEDNLTSPVHQTNKRAAAEEQPLSPTIKSSAVSSTLADLKVALQDLSGELRQERQGSQELTQQFAKAKASWEVERTELKSLIMQLETKTGKAAASLAASDVLEHPDLKVALKKEREEHQHLLAESYAAVMDLTKQLQIGERNWSREKLELLERFSQERAQWEQRLREATAQQGKSKSGAGESSADTVVSNGTGSPRTKSTSELSAGVNGTANQERFQFALPPLLVRSELGDLTRKNWTCLTNETPEVGDTCKTWDGSCSSLMGPQLDLESVQRSYTAPDRTSIRIYYSPPAVRRMEHRRRDQEATELQQAQNGRSSPGPGVSGAGAAAAEPLALQQSSSSFSSSYEQWLSSLSKQHRELLESRSGCAAGSLPGVVNNSFGGSGGSLAEGMAPPPAFHGLEIGEISANLSDDMKEMTNCVRQAIRSSSLERKSPKEPGSQAVGVSTRSTQTASQYVSIGLQTESFPSSRGTGLHSKPWSPRPSSTTVSSLASARTRQISTSLDKVHSRIERPCCSPKYGSPKLQRRVSSGSTSRLDGTSSPRDRSLWSLQQRPISGGGGSAWARSTTTRDSPVLRGLTDGLSSLFSVVEQCGSTESLWRGDGEANQLASPSRQTAAAGKPTGVAVCGSDPSSQRYSGLVQEFFRSVCSSRAPGGLTLPAERVQRDSLGCLSIMGGLGAMDEPKTEFVSAGVGGHGALAGVGGANDNVTRIVNKRLMRQTAGEEMVSIMGGGKEAAGSAGSTGSGMEDAPCECVVQASCLVRPSRTAARHSLVQCKHRPQESPTATEEKGDTCNE